MSRRRALRLHASCRSVLGSLVVHASCHSFNSIVALRSVDGGAAVGSVAVRHAQELAARDAKLEEVKEKAKEFVKLKLKAVQQDVIDNKKRQQRFFDAVSKCINDPGKTNAREDGDGDGEDTHLLAEQERDLVAFLRHSLQARGGTSLRSFPVVHPKNTVSRP